MSLFPPTDTEPWKMNKNEDNYVDHLILHNIRTKKLFFF